MSVLDLCRFSWGFCLVCIKFSGKDLFLEGVSPKLETSDASVGARGTAGARPNGKELKLPLPIAPGWGF